MPLANILAMANTFVTLIHMYAAQVLRPSFSGILNHIPACRAVPPLAGMDQSALHDFLRAEFRKMATQLLCPQHLTTSARPLQSGCRCQLCRRAPVVKIGRTLLRRGKVFSAKGRRHLLCCSPSQPRPVERVKISYRYPQGIYSADSSGSPFATAGEAEVTVMNLKETSVTGAACLPPSTPLPYAHQLLESLSDVAVPLGKGQSVELNQADGGSKDELRPLPSETSASGCKIMLSSRAGLLPPQDKGTISATAFDVFDNSKQQEEIACKLENNPYVGIPEGLTPASTLSSSQQNQQKSLKQQQCPPQLSTEVFATKDTTHGAPSARLAGIMWMHQTPTMAHSQNPSDDGKEKMCMR